VRPSRNSLQDAREDRVIPHFVCHFSNLRKFRFNSHFTLETASLWVPIPSVRIDVKVVAPPFHVRWHRLSGFDKSSKCSPILNRSQRLL